MKIDHVHNIRCENVFYAARRLFTLRTFWVNKAVGDVSGVFLAKRIVTS